MEEDKAKILNNIEKDDVMQQVVSILIWRLIVSESVAGDGDK